jgi:hypothetical protein
MKTSQTVDKAAKRFFFALLGPDGKGMMWDYTDHKAKPLIVSAFHLYAEEWKGSGVGSVTQWQYPANQLTAAKETGAIPFSGDEPWNVLFQRAVALARPDLLIS